MCGLALNHVIIRLYLALAHLFRREDEGSWQLKLGLNINTSNYKFLSKSSLNNMIQSFPTVRTESLRTISPGNRIARYAQCKSVLDTAFQKGRKEALNSLLGSNCRTPLLLFLPVEMQ